MRARTPAAGMLIVVIAHGAPARQSCTDCSIATYNTQCSWPFDSGQADPAVGRQWHLQSIRACEAWNFCDEAACITGAGVTIAVVDWGVWEGHEDLADRYSAPCSEERPNPPPPCVYEGLHGTRMAGLIAAQGDNGIGGIGVAPGAQVGEIYLYREPWPDSFEPELEHAIAFQNQCFDVKAMSFDLTGGGLSLVPVPGPVAGALAAGVRDGRAGLGMIYVISAGNEADDFIPGSDARCDYDGIVASRYTIAVGGVRLAGGIESRNETSERGASLLVCAPGCALWTTNELLADPYGECIPSSGYNCVSGTSFACPIVAGVVALMLEANPDLAWRDVMEAIVRTAATIDPGPAWQTNTAGFDHSYEYGHGMIDAYAAVEHVASPEWTPLLAEREISLSLEAAGELIGPGQTRTLTIEAPAAMRVEHVELLLDVSTIGAPGVGPLGIEIERVEPRERGGGPLPLATRSILALARADSTPAYRDSGGGPARFTSVRHWGESGVAAWKVRIRNTSTIDDPVAAVWNLAELNLCGTPLCIADWDMDTDASSRGDWDLYISMWTARDPRADLTGDRRIDGDDAARFVAEFTAGCP